uniref:Peptidase S8/S53 domain-containing protein n=1 Tax=Fagus sylvatica TaxID=28930 RepID=A0A2N9HTP1_FAGSY
MEACKAAIRDEVDIISVSLSHPEKHDYYTTFIAHASFLAMKHGILTVAAGGNYSPLKETVRNFAPWMGSSFNPFKTELLPFEVFPTLRNSNPSPAVKAKLRELLEDCIVLCDTYQESIIAKKAGAKATLYRERDKLPFARSWKKFTAIWIPCEEAARILRYTREKNKSGTQKAKIFQCMRVDNPNSFKVPHFSSRGPNPITKEILKPDLCAPGVEICVPELGGQIVLLHGTSFACPHVAAKAAFSPDRKIADVYSEGAGFINFPEALDPGLVYACDDKEFVNFLVGQGYKKKSLRKIFEWNGDKTKAIKASELNYPSLSIAVPRTKIQYSVDIPRNLTYVGSTSSTLQSKS